MKLRALILSVFLSLIMTVNVCATNFLNVESKDENTDILINRVDGYSLEIPKGAKARINENNFKTQVDFDDVNVKIFLEDLKKKVTYEEYRNYSLLGIKNTATEHIITDEKGLTLRGKESYYIEFNRRKLTGVKGDKNHYLIIFQKLAPHRAMTFMVKSDKPVDKERIFSMVSSVKLDVDRVENSITKVPNDIRIMGDGLKGADYWSKGTKKLYRNDFLESTERKWGIFVNTFWSSDKFNRIEKELEHRFRYLLLYHDTGFSNTNYTQAVQFARVRDSYIELTFQTQMQEGVNEIYDVLQGKKEDFIREMARKVRVAEHPVLFRIGNEMNGDWCSYSAYNTGLDSDIYIYLYDYIYRIFAEEGANKYTIYVFNPNGKSFPDFRYNDESMYRPHHSKYQVLGLTLYNTGNYYPGEYWTDFELLYKDLYKDSLKNYDKPMMITEFAASTRGGDKVAWTEDMFKVLEEKFPEIKVAIWFSGIDLDAQGEPARIYDITEPTGILEVFKKYLKK
ncbi:MAG: glycosyl hydrolase [Peptoniphilus sp.]|nr:glycosyl hydrolase [Peptoniphilus sp.]